MADIKAEIRSPTIRADVYRATLPGGTAGHEVEIGNGLKLENNVLSVDTADEVEQDNTKPVTSGAVHMKIGNIEALLATI